MQKTSIEWVRGNDGSPGYTVNPIRARNIETGAVGHFCEKISPGCSNCYASDWNERVRPQPTTGKLIGTGLTFLPENRSKVEIFLDTNKLRAVLNHNKAARIFWCDMTDLFGEWVTDEMLDQCFAVMALTPHHTHILVTKRPERAHAYLTGGYGLRVAELLLPAARGHAGAEAQVVRIAAQQGVLHAALPNVWLLVSAENQRMLDDRMDWLLKTPAAVRGISAEPLLGGLDIAKHRPGANRLWLIVGGESGRGKGIRTCWVPWVRSVVRQGQQAGAAVFVKQLGANVRDRNDAGFDGCGTNDIDGRCSWPEMDPDDIEESPDGVREEYQGAPVRVHLRDRKGGTPDEWPEDLRVREWPVA